MTVSAPRKVVHQGVVLASGLYFPTALYSESEAAHRIIATWRPGATVFRVPTGLVYRFDAPMRIRAETADGVPLANERGQLVSAPLSSSEWPAVQADAQSCVLVVSGRVECLRLETPIDPSLWLDTGAFGLVDVQSLGQPSEVKVEEPARVDMHSKIIRNADPRRAEMIKALAEAAERKGAPKAPSLLQRAAAALGGFLQRLLGASSEEGERGEGTKKNAPTTGSRGFLVRLAWKLTAFLARTVLGSFLSQKQAQYFSELMEAFDRGDLDEALRRAVPLNSKPRDEPLPPTLGVPGRRDDLEISVAGARVSRVLAFGGGVFQDLHRRYREAANQLVARGRLKDAAFVFADLLNDPQRAVELLERAGELTLAAELAEARGLAGGLVVRLWFLAGNVARAISIAIQRDAFHDAIVRLERSGKAQDALRLRLLWADRLAEGGDFGAAVNVLWPAREGRPLALRWMDLAIAEGGPMGGRMMVRKLMLSSEPETPLNERMALLLEESEPDGQAVRLAIAHELTRPVEKRRPPANLVRRATRALLRDAILPGGAAGSAVQEQLFRSLLAHDSEGLLAADAPPLHAHSREAEAVVTHSFPAADRGLVRASCAALLGDGRLLIGMGAAGLSIRSRSGAVAGHLDVPTDRIVLPDVGSRVLLLHQRGIVRVSQFDALRSQIDRRWSVELTTVAPSHDGKVWFVAQDNTLLALELAANEPRAVWRIPELGRRILQIARKPAIVGNGALVILTASVFNGEAAFEEWIYELPSFALRQRRELSGYIVDGKGEGQLEQLHLSPDGLHASLIALNDGTPPTRSLRLSLHRSSEAAQNFVSDRSGRLMIAGEWVAVVVGTPLRQSVIVQHAQKPGVRRTLTFSGARDADFSLTAQTLIAWDDLGRLIAMELITGRLIRDLRLT